MTTFEKKTVIEGGVFRNGGYDRSDISSCTIEPPGSRFKWRQDYFPYEELLPPEALPRGSTDCEGDGPEGTFEIVVRFTPKEKAR